MAKLTSEFFQTRVRRASYYRNSPKQILVHSGISLSLRGRSVGTIIANKDTKEFEVSVVNSADKLFQNEFSSFAEADRFAWLSATSS